MDACLLIQFPSFRAIGDIHITFILIPVLPTPNGRRNNPNRNRIHSKYRIPIKTSVILAPPTMTVLMILLFHFYAWGDWRERLRKANNNNCSNAENKWKFARDGLRLLHNIFAALHNCVDIKCRTTAFQFKRVNFRRSWRNARYYLNFTRLFEDVYRTDFEQLFRQHDFAVCHPLLEPKSVVIFFARHHFVFLNGAAAVSLEFEPLMSFAIFLEMRKSSSMFVRPKIANRFTAFD